VDPGGSARGLVVSRRDRRQARAARAADGTVPKCMLSRAERRVTARGRGSGFSDFHHLVSMMPAPPSPPLSVVSVWYQFQCASKVLSACIGHVQTILAVLLNV
jgi:hypothetical protein